MNLKARIAGVMRRTLIVLANRLAGKQICVDQRISPFALVGEFWYRGRCLIRAQWKLLLVPGALFRLCEPGVIIRNRQYLKIGRASILERGTNLRCLSSGGFIFGSHVTIGKYSILECTGVLTKLGRGITIGDHSSIGDYSFIGAAGGVKIGNNVLMGQRVSIHAQNHNYKDADIRIDLQGTSEEGVEIGDGSWLGSGSIILDGVKIGAGSVVAAGSVVTKSCAPLTVLAGSPAKAVGKRQGSVSDGTHLATERAT